MLLFVLVLVLMRFDDNERKRGDFWVGKGRRMLEKETNHKQVGMHPENHDNLNKVCRN